ncbi:protein arginine N-methyltransferase 1 [Ctenocephalides felis]|uniref:protein arginine N-methyltransferase 1 n=1 Tax=Ctenocephalides felis TaxID=7515 RepID=UPI000E6E45CD|nr:protein arginine N-methyltransferase 1 [Ctenocephalides felis]
MSSDDEIPHLSEEDDSDWDEIEEDINVKCLFCDNVLLNLDEAVEHLNSKHEFDLYHLKKKHNMDCYSYIKMINYIQKEKPSPVALMSSEIPLWCEDQYLKPTVEDDPWIMFDFEYLVNKKQNEVESKNVDNTSVIEIPVAQFTEMKNIMNQMKQELEEKDNYITMILNDMEKMKSITNNFIENLNANEEGDLRPINSVGGLDIEHDEGYFNSYAHYGIHYEMLSDKVRTESYRNAILKNSNTFKDKEVLDLGCGTGILSMFSAQAGAKHVTGIDMSDIIYNAMDIVRENGFGSVITLLKNRLEDIEFPIQKFDIIVSEWMGYFLLFEGMLDSVIYARDNYLKPGGIILPNRCNISIVGSGDIEDHNSYVNFWKDVYGFKMSCMKTNMLKETSVEIARKEHLITDPCIIVDIDINNCTTECVNFTYDFSLTCKKDGYLTSLIGYFDTFFELEVPVEFSTGPYTEPTHWKQTIFYLKNPIEVKADQLVTGTFSCKRDTKNVRGLLIHIKIFNESYEYRM